MKDAGDTSALNPDGFIAATDSFTSICVLACLISLHIFRGFVTASLDEVSPFRLVSLIYKVHARRERRRVSCV